MYGIMADQNGPWHTDDKTGEVWLVELVRDPVFLLYLKDGDLKTGDRIAMYTPEPDSVTNEVVWVWFGTLKEWKEVDVNGVPYVLTYILLEE